MQPGYEQPGAQPFGMQQPAPMQQPMGGQPAPMQQQNPPGMTPYVPLVVDAGGKALGARTPPSFWAKCCYPPCAISGYETGDPTAGMCEGKAMLACVLEVLCCLGCIVSLCMWQPLPENIKGDGTQRTVENKCMAGFCLGFTAIAFWENGDLCCTPDGQCTWFTEGAMVGCLAHFIPSLMGFVPLDCCFVMCCWQAQIRNFKRSTQNHGGGQPMVGAPVQQGDGYVPFHVPQSMAFQMQMQAPQVVGVVQPQVVQAGTVVAVGAPPPGGAYGAAPGAYGTQQAYGNATGQ